MKICTLLENTSCREDLQAEHGLSLYVESCGKRVLFDTGQTGIFADNAEKLGINLQSVDFVILSHGHYDHGGGLKRFLEINNHAPVYIHKLAFLPHYHGPKYIGLDPELQKSERVIFTEGTVDLGDGFLLDDCNDRVLTESLNSFGLTVREDGTEKPDDFRHEQYLQVTENGKRFLFTGCSHKGILNLEEWFQPDVLVGGFHFKKMDPERDRPVLLRAAHTLLRYPTLYYTGHCTGASQFAYLKTVMDTRLHALSTGFRIQL